MECCYHHIPEAIFACNCECHKWEGFPKMTIEELRILHTSWIDQCMEERHKLSDWERNFVIDIRLQLREKGRLSDKQAEVLERIYADKTD